MHQSSSRLCHWILRSGLSLAILLGADLQAADWSQFRGPTGQGHSNAKNLPAQFGESKNVAWKTAIPGRGWSSPVVDQGQVWMTSAIVSLASEEEKHRQLEKTANPSGLEIASKVVLHAICVDQQTGELLHNVEVLTIDEPEPIHTLNSFASPTPLLEDGRLYCHFGTYGTVCLDTHSLKVLWSNRALKVDHQNGPGSSPVLWRDLVIFHCDGRDVQYVAALHKRTGVLAWKTSRSGTMPEREDFRKAYCTPLVIEEAGQPAQLVSPAADWVYSYDPLTGKELWKAAYGHLGFSNVARPVYQDGVVYICTCFMQSSLLAVRCDGSGDVTNSHILWRHDKQAPKMPSPILADGLLFMVSDKGIASCLDAKTGELQWRERLGGNFSASPVLADGRLYFFNREGKAFSFRPSREFQSPVISELDGEFMASAVPLGNCMLLRTDSSLYRIESK